MKNSLKTACTTGALAILLSAQALASVVINGTRVIFPSNEREVTIRMSNEGVSPGLVQVWMDTGDVNAQPGEVQVPFILTPPLFRVDPAKAQTIRMIYNNEPLAQDQETLYWLNMLEVPPKPKDADVTDNNFMQMAFRTRIKVFFRPKALNSLDDVFAAPAKMTWKLTRDSNGQGYVFEATNPTPYYITISKLGITNGKPDNIEALNQESDMVAPGKSVRFVMKDLKAMPAATAKVRFSFINDYGGLVDVDSDFSR